MILFAPLITLIPNMQQVLPRIATVFKCLHIPHVPIGAHGLVINFKRCANNTGFTSGIREISNTRRNEKGEEPGESEVVKPIVGDSIASKSRSKLPRYSPEKLVVDQFSKRVQEIWMYYKTNPTKEVDLRELCKGMYEKIW